MNDARQKMLHTLLGQVIILFNKNVKNPFIIIYRPYLMILKNLTVKNTNS